MKKRWRIPTAVCAVLLALAACESGAGGRQNDDEAKTKFGMAVYGSNTVSEETASVDAVAAAVLTDSDGVILACRLDELQLQPTWENGKLADSRNYKTKREQGDAYGMQAGGAKQEWYRQADAFCKYAVGKTVRQIAELETVDGRATDSDLSAGCTIDVTGFMKAVSMAAEHAVEGEAAASDRLGLAITAYRSGDDTAPLYDICFCAVAVGADGRLTACAADELQRAPETNGAAFLPASGVLVTKKQQGNDYQMKAASPIGLEWYEQIERLQAYLTGRTAVDIDGIELKDGRAVELAAGCTVTVDGMLKNMQKAINAAA